MTTHADLSEMDKHQLKKRVKELESALANSNRRCDFLFQQTNNGCVMLQPGNDHDTFYIREFNPGAEKIEQKRAEDILGKAILDVFPRMKTNGLFEIIQKVHQTGELQTFPVLIKEKDRILFYHQNTLTRLPNGDVMIVYNDISRLQISEEALAESEERLKLAVQSARLGLWDHNLKTGKVIRSREWAEMLGYRPEEIPDDSYSWKSLIHPDDMVHVEKEAEDHESSKKQNFSVEHRLLTKDGQYKWVLNWGKVVERDEDNQPVRAIGTHLDIDERKRSEEKLKELIDTKDRLFSIIGHDLKNPLSDILGFTNLLVNRADQYSPEKIWQFHLYMYKSAKTMQELLDNLLKWSRIQSGTLSFHPEPIDLNSLVAEGMSLFRTKAYIKKIRLQNKVDVSRPVMADKNMVETILRNLLSNALKYTEKEGEISVSTREDEKKVLITVADDGVGMNSDQVQTMFDEGNEFTTRGTSGEGGTGLGLILCKEFVEKHGETLEVESSKGKGTQFRFRLPLKQK